MLLAAVAGGAWLLGLYTYPLLRRIDAAVEQATMSGTYDEIGRLVAYPGKTKVDCPVQGEGMGVLLAIGQSNAANHASQRVVTRHPGAVLNYFEGACFAAASPLLGASAGKGEFITLLADTLVSEGVYMSVVIVSGGIGSSPIARWQRDGDLNERLKATLKELSARYRVTDVVWHQGESDFDYSTSMKTYVTSFHSLLETLTESGVQAPVFTAIATRCTAGTNGSNPVADAQRALVDNKRVFLGADTDNLLTAADRQSGTCHFTESGQVKTATAYAAAIRQARARR